jgi:cellulose synthase/poly-beta-1,6-N-acetylglucosamine synthase-like glycosyltransferase
MKILFLIILMFLLFHYAYFLIKIIIGLGKLSSFSQNHNTAYLVSIIIPFRNESKNILRSLTSIEQLNYPDEKLEIIYVDDNSTDDSFYLVDTNKKKNNIRILKLPEEIFLKGNKKRAVQYGIENCRGDIIVTTDADCIHHKNWLIHLLSCFDSETAFVSGPVQFMNASNIFSKIQSIEFEGLVLTGAGLIGNGEPVISNGANIAFQKSVFLKVGGFNGNLDLSSGDDIFLMQKISRLTDYKIKFCNSRKAVVITESSSDFRDFFNQRKRWASKSLHYKDSNLIVQLILIFLFYSGLIFQLLLIIAGYDSFLITLILSLIIKAFLEFLIIKKGESLFFPKNNTFLFFITELLQVPYVVISSITGIFGHFNWKDRRIRR